MTFNKSQETFLVNKIYSWYNCYKGCDKVNKDIYQFEKRISDNHKMIKYGLLSLTILFLILSIVFKYTNYYGSVKTFYSFGGLVRTKSAKEYAISQVWYDAHYDCLKLFRILLIMTIIAFLNLKIKKFDVLESSFTVSCSLIKQTVYVDGEKMGSTWLLPFLYHPVTIDLPNGTTCSVYKILSLYSRIHVTFSDGTTSISL